MPAIMPPMAIPEGMLSVAPNQQLLNASRAQFRACWFGWSVPAKRYPISGSRVPFNNSFAMPATR